MAEQAESFAKDTEIMLLHCCDFIAAFGCLRVEGPDSEGRPNFITFPESVISVIKTI